jgi:diguanylate cyclase (GGDEF)-like protein
VILVHPTSLPKPYLKVAPSIYLLHRNVKKRYLNPAVAMIATNSELVLIGLANAAQIEQLLLDAKTAEPTLRLSYFVLTGWVPDLPELVARIRRLAPTITLVTDVRQLHYFDVDIPSSQLYVIGEHGMSLTLADGRILSFLSSPYLLSPGSFFVYDVATATLFSSHLFSNPASGEGISPNYPLEAMQYLSSRLPSSEFVRLSTKRLADLTIQRAITLHGNVLDQKLVQTLLKTFDANDFYNLSGSLSKTASAPVDYLAYANQVVHKLKSIYGAESVAVIFDGSDLRYDPTTGDLVPNGREGFRLWHRLFELIFAKHGAEWLAVVEPVVDKLGELYQVKKPSIYQSLLVDTSKQLTILDQERERLEQAVKQLETEKQATFDRLMKDPLTGLYNELYLLGTLEAHIEARKLHPASEPFMLVYVAVDRLFRINRKYSYEIGDETIRLFAELLSSTLDKSTRVFKASGAALALLFESTNAKDRLEQILVTVRESTHFVEPITASLAIVSSEDVNLDQDVKDVAQQMITLAENRVQVAYQKGGNRIVDKDTPIEAPSRGRVLLIDNDDIHANYLSKALKNEGFDVDVVGDGLDAIQRINEQSYTAFVCDKFVPRMDAFAIKAAINKTTQQSVCFLMITHQKTADLIIRANKLGITAVIQKPILSEEVVGFILRNRTSKE